MDAQWGLYLEYAMHIWALSLMGYGMYAYSMKQH